MPANEQTWRSQKTLHKVFAVTGVLLLVSTVWMFAKDHNREWHEYQDKFRDMELKLTRWRMLQQQTDDVVVEHERLQEQLAEVRGHGFPPEVLQAFRDEVQADARRRERAEYNFARLNRLERNLNEAAERADEKRGEWNEAWHEAQALAQQVEELTSSLGTAETEAATAETQAAADEADEALQAAAIEARNRVTAMAEALEESRARATEAATRADTLEEELRELERDVAPRRAEVIETLETILNAARFREDEALRARKFEMAELDAFRANVGLGVRDGLPQSRLDELQDIVDEQAEIVDRRTEAYEAAADHRLTLQDYIETLVADEEELLNKIEVNQGEMVRLERAFVERRVSFFTSNPPFLGKKWLELPILDAFNSPHKIENLWSEGLDQPIGSFGKVRRFDRCTTCHQGIDKTMPGSAVEPGYEREHLVEVVLPLPDELPLINLTEGRRFSREDLARFFAREEVLYAERGDEPDELTELTAEKLLDRWLGIQLAEDGLLDPSDVTVRFVYPGSPGARAPLADGDATLPEATGRELRERMFRPDIEAVPARLLVPASAFPLDRRVEIELSGTEGTVSLDLDEETDVLDIVAMVNERADLTGVIAYDQENDLVLETTGTGEESFVELEFPRRGQMAESSLESSLEFTRVSGQTIELQASPGLAVGDVIYEVRDDPTRFQGDPREWVMHQLLDRAWENYRLIEAGEDPLPPIPLTLRRGVPHPYASHPRLDLFVGSLSPHRMATFACTICHEGQGSATAFRWASHSPDSTRERERWRDEYGWFDNHHWIYPMFPTRFVESGCLKCHHEVVELEPSDRYPDPPAPTLMQGYQLIRKYGCYGCHEINGYDGPDSRVGPDLRLEPNFFAAAQQFKHAPGTGYEQLDLADQLLVDQVIMNPERDDLRHQLLQLLEDDLSLAMETEADTFGEDVVDIGAGPRFSSYVHEKLLPLLRDVEIPGTQRKAGPSLRFVEHKLDPEFMYDWIHEPQDFRPSTRMPAFFGLWNHLELDERVDTSAFEEIEIYSMVQYLRHYSQDYAYLDPPDEVPVPQTEEELREQVERGRVAFQERGCLACHTHDAFPGIQQLYDDDYIVQGPDLSAIGTKFDADRNPNGARWLYSWIKQPSSYHVRTVMPDLYLDPIEERDENGDLVRVTDPAADIVAFLMADSVSDWEPDALVELDGERLETMRELALQHLSNAFFRTTAEEYLETGIPQRMADDLKGDEVELLVDDGATADESFELPVDQILLYLGRRTISKYGCYACHDIPGFEDAKPIGTGLADWGRKEPEKLAFEHIVEYIEHGHGHHVDHSHEHGAGDEHGDAGMHAEIGDEVGPRKHPPSYYMQQLESHNRIGFIYQKLLEPRSYDYHKVENKGYGERLRMPQFPFSDQEREAVITFVLGLVADPPSSQYVYEPDARTRALIEGRVVLEKYNCAGCHVLEAERWEIRFPEGSFGPQSELVTYPFVPAHFSPAEIVDSRSVDTGGLQRAVLEGMPALADDGRPMVYDDEQFPLNEEDDAYFDPAQVVYAFDLWRPTLVGGEPYQVGVLPVNVPADHLYERYRAEGGYLAMYLLPHVVERVKVDIPGKSGNESWAWVPPPLVGEGLKVQSDWLHSFLLDPYEIRPSVVLRMPRFNMSSDEATRLVNYFAARDNADYPYEYDAERRDSHLAAADTVYGSLLQQVENLDDAPEGRHLEDAMKIVTNGNYCVKCHIVADYRPQGNARDLAPDLAEVSERLRTDYVRRWIARPNSILPYTAMPVNIVYDPDAEHLGTTVAQDLYHGTSVDQLNALVDLLMNYDAYARQQSRIAPLVQEVEPTDAETATEGPEP